MKIEKIRDGRYHITWPAKASTNMTLHRGATTVIYHQDGLIERVLKTDKGLVREVQQVKQGVPYSRRAGTEHQVTNLGSEPLDADKDERPNGDENPDDTIRKDG